MKRRKRIVLSLFVLIFAATAVFYPAQRALENNYLPEVRVLREFVALLAEADTANARNLAAGELLANLGRSKPALPPVEVVDLEVSPEARGEGWAVVQVRVETEDANGVVDVQWYRASLASDGGGWKIYRMENVPPGLAGGRGRRAGWQEAEEAREVLGTYLEFLAADRYAEAGSFLVGKAKIVHQAAVPVLSRGPLIREIGELSFTPLWRQGKFLVARAEYPVDGRQVRVVVLFYLTGEGWRIADVGQV